MGWFSRLFLKRKVTDASTVCAEPVVSVAENEDTSPDIAEKPEPEVFAPNAPALRDGLIIRPILSFNSQNTIHFSGAHVTHDDMLVITVNEIGRELLSMADGKTTIDEMVETLGLKQNASEVGLFFVTLGQAGYLKNRIEIELYETRKFIEECL